MCLSLILIVVPSGAFLRSSSDPLAEPTAVCRGCTHTLPGVFLVGRWDVCPGNDTAGREARMPERGAAASAACLLSVKAGNLPVSSKTERLGVSVLGCRVLV